MSPSKKAQDHYALSPHQMIVDPKKHELDKLSNPTDYFNIYKQKVQEIAEKHFDQDDDERFFSYLDKLVNCDEYMKSLKFDGIAILKGFITDEDSLD